MGAEEDERTNGTPRVLDPRARPDHRVRHQLHRFVLADDALVQDLVEPEQLVALAFHQAGDGDASPARDDLGDLALGDLFLQQPLTRRVGEGRLAGFQLPLQLRQAAVLELGGAVEVVLAFRLGHLAPHLLDLLAQRPHRGDGFLLLLPLGAHAGGLRLQLRELRPQRLQALPALGVLLLLEGGLLDLQLHHPPRHRVQLRRHGVDLGADGSAGFVHQIDGLVRQEAVGDVAVRKHRGGDEGGVLDADAVVHLEALAQAAQDRDRVLHVRRLHHDGLEAPLQRRVLLHVLAVLVEGGGADAVQLAPGQHGLEQVAGVG